MTRKATVKNKSKRQKQNKIAKPELPDADEIIQEVSFISPKGRKYQIIKTNEMDEYEEYRAETENDSEDDSKEK